MPLLSVFGSTAMAPFIMCDIQSHPPEVMWAEHWSPSTCGHSCLQLLWLLDIRLPHIIPCMLCLNPLWLVIDQAMTCDSPVTQNVKNQPVAVANLCILFPPTPMTQLCLQTSYTRFDSCSLTLKIGFPPLTSIDSVVSSMKSSFMLIRGGVITKLATHIWHTDICCMGSQHTFVNFMLHVLAFTVFWSNDIFTISSFMHIVSKTCCAISMSVTDNMSEVLAFVTGICLAPLMWTFMNSVNFDIAVCAQ